MPFDSNFSLDKLQKAIQQDQNMSIAPEERLYTDTNIGFIPPGEHTIRLFLDPENNLAREIAVHNSGRSLRTHCPAIFQAKHPSKNCPSTCEICRLSNKHRDWRLKSQFFHMIYVFVVDTKNPKEYWQPGNPYVGLCRKHMKKQIDQMIRSLLDKDKELLEKFFNPHIEGYTVQAHIKSNPQNYQVEIKPILDRTLPPIELGDWYKPLSECWLSEEFNISDYEAVLAALKNS